MEPQTRKRGQKDSNLRALYRLWFSRPAHSSALPCPLVDFCGQIIRSPCRTGIVGTKPGAKGGAQYLANSLWKRYKAKDETEVARTCERDHPSCGGSASSGSADRSAHQGGGQDRPACGFRHLRSQPHRVVRRERAVSPATCLCVRHSEVEEVGSHDHLHPYSGYVYPYLRAGARGWLAEWNAQSGLDPCIVLHPAQASVDGRSALALRGDLPFTVREP